MPTLRAAVVADVPAVVEPHNADAVKFWAAAGFTVEGDDLRWSLIPVPAAVADA